MCVARFVFWSSRHAQLWSSAGFPGGELCAVFVRVCLCMCVCVLPYLAPSALFRPKNQILNCG